MVLCFYDLIIMSERTTTINVSVTVWKKLNDMKMIGDTFDSVLRRLLMLDDLDKDD